MPRGSSATYTASSTHATPSHACRACEQSQTEVSQGLFAAGGALERKVVKEVKPKEQKKPLLDWCVSVRI
jgi:hypothetical protein